MMERGEIVGRQLFLVENKPLSSVVDGWPASDQIYSGLGIKENHVASTSTAKKV